MLLVSGCIRSYSLAWGENPIFRAGVLPFAVVAALSFEVVAWLLVVAAEE